MPYTTEQIRNLALAGHPGAGKTLLFDALLHAGGAIAAIGSIERGSTTSDFDPIEKSRGHSLDAAVASLDHGGIHLNLVDTPGYPDFRRPALSVLVVNKLDHGTGGAGALLESLRAAFGPEVLPLNLPADGGKRVVDCFGAAAADSTEDSDAGPVAEWHRRIIDQVVEVNETVMDRYLDHGEAGLRGAELHDAFEQCLREGHLVPVCFVSAKDGTGVAELLSIAERLFPHPGEANRAPFVKGAGDKAVPIEAAPDPRAHVIAHVFKVANDPFVGKLGVFRVHQGTIRRDAQLFVDDGRKPFKVAHLFRLQGKDHVEIREAIP